MFRFSFSIGQTSTQMHTHKSNSSSNLLPAHANLTVLHGRSYRSARFPKAASELDCCFSHSATLLCSTMLFHSPCQLKRKRRVNHLVLYAVAAQQPQAPEDIHAAPQEIGQCGIPSLSMTHAATYKPNHQQVTHAGLARSALCTPAAVISGSLKVSYASPRQQYKAKGIDAPIKEKTNATCCGDQKATVNK